MAAAVLLRDDFDGLVLRGLAKSTKDAAQARRLLALAEICDGGSRSDAARIGGVGLQTIRDWVLRFNARGPAGLIDGKAPGNASKLDEVQRQALRGTPCAANARIWLLTASRVIAASHWIRSALLKVSGSMGSSGESALRNRGSSDRTAARKAVEAFSNRCQRSATCRACGAASAAAAP